METIVTVVLGIVFIIIGIVNMSGNISLLHSYHRKRVAEEDKKPMGRVVGLGMLIIGGGMIPSGILFGIAELTSKAAFSVAGGVLLAVSMTVGLILNLYGIIKYNKGLF